MSRAHGDFLFVACGFGDGVRFRFPACPQCWREFRARGVS